MTSTLSESHIIIRLEFGGKKEACLALRIHAFAKLVGDFRGISRMHQAMHKLACKWLNGENSGTEQTNEGKC